MDAWFSHAHGRVLAAGAGLALVLLAAGGAAAQPAGAVSPPTITVDTIADGDLDSGATTCTSSEAGGRCTLRAAIELNEAAGGGGTVTLGAGQFQLSRLLGILKSVSITGAGPNSSQVLGTANSGVFLINNASAVVSMTGLGILNGTVPGSQPSASGGGIKNVGSLTLRDVLIKGNTAVTGGGIADFGSLTLESGVVVTQNRASESGGGIAEFGALTATAPVFSANTAGTGGNLTSFGGNLTVGESRGGDGLPNQFGHATISGATIAQGSATAGAGVFVDSAATAVISASTFADNAGDPGRSDGGGLFNSCGAVTLTNDTFDRNRAPQGFGGAIDDVCESDIAPSTPKPMTALDFVTIADGGAADGEGAGLVNAGGASTVTVRNTIIANGANNAAHNCATFLGGKIVSLGHNLEDRNDCTFGQAGDLTNTDPKLGGLKDNGSSTQTMALAAGTPAVDAAGATCDVKTDQRGVSRPQGAACDIGAFELEQVAAAPAPTRTPSPSASATVLPQPPVTGTGPGTAGSGVPAGLLFVLVALLFAAGGTAALLRFRARAN